MNQADHWNQIKGGTGSLDRVVMTFPPFQIISEEPQPATIASLVCYNIKNHTFIPSISGMFLCMCPDRTMFPQVFY